jgi:hypothetical protein
VARPEVLSRIRALLPKARLIAVLREPVSRLILAYHYSIKIGLLPAILMEEGMLRLLAGDHLGSLRAAELLENGRYVAHLERYVSLFHPFGNAYTNLRPGSRANRGGT